MAVEVRNDRTLLDRSLQEAHEAWLASLVGPLEERTSTEARIDRMKQIAKSLPISLQDAFWQQMPEVRNKAQAEANLRNTKQAQLD